MVIFGGGIWLLIDSPPSLTSSSGFLSGLFLYWWFHSSTFRQKSSYNNKTITQRSKITHYDMTWTLCSAYQANFLLSLSMIYWLCLSFAWKIKLIIACGQETPCWMMAKAFSVAWWKIGRLLDYHRANYYSKRKTQQFSSLTISLYCLHYFFVFAVVGNEKLTYSILRYQVKALKPSTIDRAC